MKQSSINNLDFRPAAAAQMSWFRRLHVATAIYSRLSLVKKIMKRLMLVFLCFPLVALAQSALDKAAVLVLSPYDQNIVIELPDSDMHALSVGQKLEGIDAVLIDVLEDRAVFEEIVVSANGTKVDVRGCTSAADAGCVGAVKETVWIYKAVNGVSLVQRLSRQTPAAPVHEVTRVISSESKADTATTK